MISDFGSTYFYEVQLKDVDCFDQNLNFIETIQLDDYCDKGKLVVFNNTLLMSSFVGKRLIKFR